MTKILIVDDNPQNLYMLQVLLQGNGYEVVSATNGAEALDKARRDPPDVIISDILMPVMDGFTLCRQWMKDDRLKAIPFVFYTATYTDPRDEELALSLGAARFIVKPVEPEVFAEMVREIIKEAREGRLVAPRKPIEEEPVYLKEYSEQLVKKLEDKMVQLERAKRRLTVLYEASVGLATLKPADELVPHILRTVVEAMDFPNGSYFAYDEEQEAFHLQEAVGFPDELVEVFRRELVLSLGEERGLVGLVGQTRKPLIVADTQADPRWIALNGAIRSALFVPVVYKDQLLGVANFLSTEVGAFDEEDARNVMTLANNLAIAIENASLVEDLRQSEERYRRLAENAQDLIYRYHFTPSPGFDYVSPAATEITGYTPAEHYADPDLGFKLVHPDDRPKLEAYFQGEGAFEEPITLRWVRKDGVVIWTEQRNVPIYDDAGNLVAIEGIARDVTERKRAEEELRQSYEKLRVALGGTIAVLTSVVEIRDPYTAGHQQRVAELACAIANDLGLAEEHIEGIRMAGLIHDLGKINVPAEILSKPSRLNDFEWGMIKMHPQVGYDILKTVEFPWPVAQTVLQHHERLDGSGYPQGLTGKDILMKARILAVADVVEAMASFRPYRPARGLDKALEEISQNRGILYDAEVVDACLKLFTEDGFEFE